MSDWSIGGLTIKHDRDNKTTTNVMQAWCAITNVKTFKDRLIYARERRKMTQQDLADASGVEQSAIGNYESGLRKSSRKVVALARALNVSVEWLEEGKGNPDVPYGMLIADEAHRVEVVGGWPFEDIDEEKVRALDSRKMAQLEAAILIASKQVGLDVWKVRKSKATG